MTQHWPTFEYVLDRRKFVKAHYRALTTRMELTYADELQAAYKAAFPKRKKPDLRKLFDVLPDDAVRIKRRWTGRASKIAKAYHRFDERTKPVLRRLARDRDVPEADTPQVYKTTYKSTYSTQGWGAEKYARESAQLDADKVAMHGVRVEVVRVGKPDVERFEVHAWTDELGVELLRDKPEVPMRDWIKACWARGVNPRVYCPFLPHGLEEKLGVDYQGRDVLRPIRQRTRAT